MAPACDLAVDQIFGPAVQCPDQFDFTLYFEQAIFDIGVSGLFLLLVPLRFYFLWGTTTKCRKSPIYIAKIAASLLTLGVQLACLVLWIKNPLTHVSIAAAVVQFVGGIAVVGLVLYEYSRTTRPSTITSLYLLATVVGRSVQLRTLATRDYVPVLTGLLAASLGTQLFLLLLELWSKIPYLLPTEEPYGPEETAGVVNRTFFWWLNPLFLLGNRRILTYSDLTPLDHSFHAVRLQERMHRSWAKFEHKGPIGFVYAYFDCFKWELLQTLFPRACVIAFGFAQTFLITATINYLEQPEFERDVRHAYGLIGAAAVIYGGIAFANVKFTQRVFRIITTFRGATCSLIFAKSLCKKAGHSDLAAVTLMSTDVDRLTMSLQLLVEVWAQLLSVAIGIWLLWRQLGPVAIAPILVTMLCFFVQSYISRFMGSRQARWVAAVQRRIGIASSTLRSMKAIKLSGLVDSMAYLLQSERVRELKLARNYRVLNVWVQVVVQTPTIFGALVVFAAYAIQAKIQGTSSFSTAQAFTSLAIISLLTMPAAILLMTIPSVAAGYGCVKRIEAFLNSADFDDRRDIARGKESQHSSFEKHRENSDDQESSSFETDNIALSASKLVFGPSAEKSGDPVTFHSKTGSLTTVLGPVGCGKSTFLRTILNEIKPTSGRVSISTPYVGYCAQTPWLPNALVRDIITGPNAFDEAWYKSIVQTCALEEDFRQMPNNDLTLIGSRGIVLSGGQKHRISLARALYSRCSVLVLDDFLSSLDHKTQDYIAQRLMAKDGHVRRHGCTVLLATHITNFVHLSDTLLVFGPGGSIEYYGPPDQWPNKRPLVPEEAEAVEENHKDLVKVKSAKQPGLPKPVAAAEVRSEDVKRQTGDWGVWVYYCKSIGIWPILLAVIFVIISVFCVNFPKLWLQQNTGSHPPSVGLFVGVYALVSFAGVLATAGMLYQFLMVIAPRSAIALHHVLVKSAFGAPMSFFENTDSSVLLNRFSQDMSLIDMQLPMAGFQVLSGAFQCIMNAILICLGSSYVAAIIPGTLFVLYWIQKFYLRTSRQIRLLDLETKTPLYQQFTETLEGVETIRAFGWQKTFERVAREKLDMSQRPFYLMWCIQRWLNLVLDMLVACLAILLVGLALCLPKSSSAGALGVALTSLLAFNQSLKGLITAWTQAETSIGSVARTETFEKDTPTEIAPEEDLDPGKDWPLGNVEVSNMSLQYKDGTKALKNVSFAIKSGQTFGVCGRTGSGKSTLLSSFLRLLDPTDGKIMIDGVDISKVPRNVVRDRLICLPQDALVFPGTFRFNLDPTDRIPDDSSISAVLERVRLLDLVEKRGGITSNLKPDSLSHGEQQLLALARAILRKQAAGGKCILVLDEATSNLDLATEALIQEVINEEFRETTVIVVAHRMETVREADAILLLEKGEVSKIGTPAEVL